MSNFYEDRINWLCKTQNQTRLKEARRGIEKESLRVSHNGTLSQKPHPSALGSALTHPQITTDYSEALLEFITGTHPSIEGALAELSQIHALAHHHLEDEYLWGHSMPCKLGDNESIPIATYGNSNLGKMKHVYRKGLDVRYGRKMQTIAGIHYNFSLSPGFWQQYQDAFAKTTKQPDDAAQRDFISTQYFSLIRNAHRLGWLPIFLFGSSPAIDESFHNTHHPQLKTLGKRSRYAPHGTSLRMSNLGYQNSAQSGLTICYNTLKTYIKSLDYAIQTPSSHYSALGKYDTAGNLQQINTHLLQIENEYYGSIRPKRNASNGERPNLGLAKAGVEYVELRSLDLDPFEPAGISNTSCFFIETFLLYALLAPSPLLSQIDINNIQHNLNQCIFHAKGKAMMKNAEQRIELIHWASKLLEQMQPAAQCLAEAMDEPGYLTALEQQVEKLKDFSLLPSTRILTEMSQESYQDFISYGLAQAKQNKAHYADALTPAQLEQARKTALNSIEAQRSLEQQTQLPFEEFLSNYFETTQ